MWKRVDVWEGTFRDYSVGITAGVAGKYICVRGGWGSMDLVRGTLFM